MTQSRIPQKPRGYPTTHINVELAGTEVEVPVWYELRLGTPPTIHVQWIGNHINLLDELPPDAIRRISERLLEER